MILKSIFNYKSDKINAFWLGAFSIFSEFFIYASPFSPPSPYAFSPALKDLNIFGCLLLFFHAQAQFIPPGALTQSFHYVLVQIPSHCCWKISCPSVRHFLL